MQAYHADTGRELRVYTDQLGRSVHVPFPPRRIVSLVPSQTELLHHLGLDEAVVGITRFCVHPQQWFREKPRVGGTKQLHLDRIAALQPDLVIANREENDKEQVTALMQQFPVWTSDIHTLAEALQMIGAIGDITGRSERALQLVQEIRQAFAELENNLHVTGPPVRTAYLIWQDPWMAAGGDTFINGMMEACGLENVFAHLPRYPVIQLEQLQDAGCGLVLLSSEPYPFREKHLAALQPALPGTRILLADGEMFSWYGSRLRLAPAYFRELTARARQ